MQNNFNLETKKSWKLKKALEKQLDKELQQEAIEILLDISEKNYNDMKGVSL